MPFGESDLEWAAARFVMNVNAVQWTRLEEVLQSLVLSPLGGLHAICQKSGDLISQLSNPLVDQTAAFLDQILDVADISKGEFASGGKPADLVAMIQKCYERALPLIRGESSDEHGFLVLPTSEAGNALAEDVRARIPAVRIMHALGQTSDIMVCREQGNLRSRSLEGLVGHCRSAYSELVSRPSTSPHARFDILEWMPLDI